ncbi:SWI5-dependent HO expression protein 4 [Mycoemilia scoparia]|uniref:SWI5-dependent HO expression protein 4 n=1 Tax=Mycoemilia scoparia TaxID=417184 RepID=A0A9W8DWU4_9FUNG|nr:SWI5-dependent HO expression protein 4 [Mycoemilia scoparia]
MDSRRHKERITALSLFVELEQSANKADLLLKRSALYKENGDFEKASKDLKLAAGYANSKTGAEASALNKEIQDAIVQLSKATIDDVDSQSVEELSIPQLLDDINSNDENTRRMAIKKLSRYADGFGIIKPKDYRAVFERLFDVYNDNELPKETINVFCLVVDRIVQNETSSQSSSSETSTVFTYLKAIFEERASEYGCLSLAIKLLTSSVFHQLKGEKADTYESISRNTKDALEYYIHTVFPSILNEKITQETVQTFVRGMLQILKLNKLAVLETLARSYKNGLSPGLSAIMDLAGRPHGDLRQSGSVILLSEIQNCGLGSSPETTSKLAESSKTIFRRIKQTIEGWIDATTQNERRKGFYCLASILPVDSKGTVALPILTQTEFLKDTFELIEYDHIPTQVAFMELCSEALGDSGCRKLINEHGKAFIIKIINENKSAQEASRKSLFTVASKALSKLIGAPQQKDPSAVAKESSATSEGEASGIKEFNSLDSEQGANDSEELLKIQMETLSSIFDSSKDPEADQSLLGLVEGLCYMSLKAKLKDTISINTSLLTNLFKVARSTKKSHLRFHIVALCQNLTQYLPALTEEQKALLKLRQKASSTDSKTDDIEADRKYYATQRVQVRSKLLAKSGCVPCLVEAIHPKLFPSDGVKNIVAQALCNLATAPELRGLIVQQGGATGLLRLIDEKGTESKDIPPKPYRSALDRTAAHTLAKLAISLPPHIAFPNGMVRSLVRPFLSLCVEEQDNKLSQFEALMALTNLASTPPQSEGDVRGLIAFDLKGLSVIEFLVLSSHPMIQRAATELLCNLVSDMKVFDHYASSTIPKSDEKVTEGQKSYQTSKIHLFVALSDCEDIPTKIAASGALGVLSSDSRVCRFLALSHPTAMTIITDLGEDESNDGALQHRAVAILANMLQSGDNEIVAKIKSNDKVQQVLKNLSTNSKFGHIKDLAKSAMEAL